MGGFIMATCEVCGNDYWLAFEVRTVSGDSHTFDSFECAIQSLAPICEHCQVRIVGHGVEVSGRFFCCAHCARAVETDRAAAIKDSIGAHPG
jgi:phage terminase large subunit GpA-like protein